MELKKNNAQELTRYYISDCYEIDNKVGNNVMQKLYLGGDFYTAPAVYVNEGGISGTWQLYYIIRDCLSSITHIRNASVGAVEENSYDAWGRLRNPANYNEVYSAENQPSLLLGRGYTGHEHLPWFGLVNMNARLYDPAVGRFLSPDPYVPDGTFSQDFNRYSYARNNPMIYTDPTGEFWMFVVAGAIIGGYIGGSVKSGTWNPVSNQYWNNGWQGVVVGGIIGAGLGAFAAANFGGAATLSLMSNGTGGASLGWSMTSSALTMANTNMAFAGLTSGGDWDAMWKAGVSGLISGAISGGVHNLVYQPKHNQLGFWKGFGIHGAVGGTSSLIDGAIQGKKGWDLAEYAGWGALKQGLIGGVTDGLRSRIEGKSFWTGEDKRIRLENGCFRNIHRDPLSLSIPNPDFQAAAFPSFKIGDRTIYIPIGIGVDFDNKNKAWNTIYTHIISGEKKYKDVWYNFPVLVPLIPFIVKY